MPLWTRWAVEQMGGLEPWARAEWADLWGSGPPISSLAALSALAP